MGVPRFAGRRVDRRRRRRILLGIASVVAVVVVVAGAVFVVARQNAQPSPAEVGAAAQSASDGQPVAQDFTVQTIDGDTFSLAGHRGEVVVVEFLAPGCPSCTVDVAGLSEAARDNPGATFLLADVSGASDPQTLRDYYRGELEAAPELLIAHDTDFQLAHAYGVRALGHTVVITPDGKISWTGRWAGDRARLAAQIRKAARS